MVKELLFRRVLVILNRVLIVALLCVVMILGREWRAGNSDRSTATPSVPAETGLQLPKLKPRAAYNEITDGNLFGSAAHASAPIAHGPSDVSLPDLIANLKLRGTTTTYPSDPLGSAVIEEASTAKTGSSKTYHPGQKITDKVRLVEVFQRRVVVFNESTNQYEQLSMGDLKGGGTVVAKAKPDTNVAQLGPTWTNAFQLKRQPDTDDAEDDETSAQKQTGGATQQGTNPGVSKPATFRLNVSPTDPNDSSGQAVSITTFSAADAANPAPQNFVMSNGSTLALTGTAAPQADANSDGSNTITFIQSNQDAPQQGIEVNSVLQGNSDSNAAPGTNSVQPAPDAFYYTMPTPQDKSLPAAKPKRKVDEPVQLKSLAVG